MKKGEQRKQDILNIAEEMFCKNGYEQTSVQEIIDRLNTSKGSFYHHFISKEAVLEGICINRARQLYTAAEKECEATVTTLERLNTLLSGMIPFRDEKLQFLLMLLPVFMLPEGRIIKQYYSDAITEQFYLAICKQIQNGHEKGDLFCTDPENASKIIASLINMLWVQISDIIIRAENQKALPDLSECLHITDSYRRCIERFLSLPYGSIKLIDMSMLRILINKIHNHWSI